MNSSPWKRLLAYPEIGLGIIMVLMFAGTAAFSRSAAFGDGAERNLFLNPDNLHQIVRESSYFVIMAVGATLVLVSGGVDLSIGSIYCLSAVVAAYFMSATTYAGQAPRFPEDELRWIAEGKLPSAGARIVYGLIAGLATGTICGLINGLLITWLKSPPFLITLGTMLIFRCVAFLITKGKTLTSLPYAYVQEFGQTTLPGGLNVHVPIMLGIVALGWVLLSYSVPGRMALAIGGNEEAARTAGLPVQRIKILVYSIEGMLGGLAGVLYIAYRGAISSNDGTGYELNVIAAAVVGGASLSGGRGTAVGALLGALFLQQIGNALFNLQIDQNFEKLVIGLVIVAAAGINRLRERVLGQS